MSRWEVEVIAESGASVDEVWRLLADVTTWPSWSSFDEASYGRPGDPPPHGVGAERMFRIGPFRSVDTVLEFVPPKRLAYDYAGPLPIKNYRADVELTSTDAGTHVSWRCTFSPKIPLLGRPMRAVLRRVLGDLARQLAAGAEQSPSA